MRFRLVPTSMTLNDLERRNALILRFSRKSIALRAKYVTVVEYRHIMSVNLLSQLQSRLPILAITHTAARSLCES